MWVYYLFFFVSDSTNASFIPTGTFLWVQLLHSMHIMISDERTKIEMIGFPFLNANLSSRNDESIFKNTLRIEGVHENDDNWLFLPFQ
jgi:hypothetical protein